MTREITVEQLHGVHKDWRKIAVAAVAAGWKIKRADNGRCSLLAPDDHTWIALPGNQRAPSRHELSNARIKIRKGSPEMTRIVDALPGDPRTADDDEIDGTLAALIVARAEAQDQREAAEQEREEKRMVREQNKAAKVPFEVSRKPWLAHGAAGRGKRPGKRYESKAVLEVKMSDGTTHWACPACDYTHATNPRSVARHFAAVHSPKGTVTEQNPRKFNDPAYTEPVLIRNHTGRANRLANELVAALGEVGEWAKYEHVEDLAVALATKIVEARAEHEGDPEEWVPLTPEQTLDKIRALVDDGSYVKQREELDGLVTQVADLTTEVSRLRDERKTLAAMLGEGAVSTMRLPFDPTQAVPLGRFRPWVTDGYEHVRHLCTRCGIPVGNPSRKRGRGLCKDCVDIETTISHICQGCHEEEVHYNHRRKGYTTCPNCRGET